MRPALRVVVAPDSFGGALDSVAVAAAIARGWSSVRPDDEVVAGRWPTAARAPWRRSRPRWGTPPSGGRSTTTDPLGRPISAEWLLLDDGPRAFVEMAAASGLAHLSPDERTPDSARVASTRGTGDV